MPPQRKQIAYTPKKNCLVSWVSHDISPDGGSSFSKRKRYAAGDCIASRSSFFRSRITGVNPKFPENKKPRYLMRDRDKIYGEDFRVRVKGLGIEEVITAFQSPWQNAFVERLIGSIRCECMDHIIVLGEKHFRRILRSYFENYHGTRTHLSLGKDAPDERTIQPPEMGAVVEIAEVG